MLTARSFEFYGRLVFLLVAICACQCAAQTVRGVVHNGTSGKSQAGDLIVVTARAREVGRAVCGQNGDFRIELNLPAGTSADSLKLRVAHDGLAYQQPIKSGFAADITIYDGASRVGGLSEYLAIFQFESRVADRLEVTELHAIQNDSWPRLTSVDPDNFDLSLPKTARHLFVTITEADGQAAKLSIPDLSRQHGPLKFGVPLQPGLTKYVLVYELPYAGKFSFRRPAQYSAKKTVVVLPMSMRFAALENLRFNPVPDKSGALVKEIDLLAKNDALTFQVAGTGVLAQAFRAIGDPNDSARQLSPTPTEKVQASGPDASPASTASNSSSQKTPLPTTSAHPMSQSGRSWAISGFVLVLGTFIAWKIAHAKNHRRAT